MTLSRDLLTRIRAALEGEVERTSLRAVARELRLSATGLRKFLDGTRPHEATCRRALGWYLRYATRRGETDAEMATAALELLVGPAARAVPELVPRLLALLAAGYQAAGLEGPGWVEVREKVGME
ncbi:MAG TPA: hypothetical protein VK399_00830 [Longimicrobiaceae bacterium]|nr:hypothetical protein [Longimicrobiaceae bacterium]